MEIIDHVERHIKLSTEENINQTIVSQNYVKTLIALLPMRVKLEKKLELASTNVAERKSQYEEIKGWIQFHQRFLSNQGISVNMETDRHVTMAVQDNVQRSNDA